MKRAVLYLRVSTVDQHPETQLYDLRQMAVQRGYEIVREYTDPISGAIVCATCAGGGYAVGLDFQLTSGT